jgi:hypothetical protein
MKTNFQAKLTNTQFKMMRSSMIAKDEAGFMGLKFLFSLAIFLVLLPVFPLAIVWFVVCTAMALNERGNKATVKAARITANTQYRIHKEVSRGQEAQRAMKPSDYYYN